jgi:PAS domain S-box-containing protein
LDDGNEASSFKLLYSNARLNALLGRDLSPFHGKEAMVHLPEITHSGLLGRCEETLRTREPTMPENLAFGKGGQDRFRAWIFPVDKNAVVLFLVSLTESGPLVPPTVHDNIVSGMAQDAQRQLGSILGATPEAKIHTDPDGMITAWDPGAELMFGHRTGDMIGMPMAMLFPPEKRNLEQVVANMVLEYGQEQRFETARLRKDGSLLAVAVTVSPIHDEHGGMVGIMQLAQPITERKKAEHELRQLILTLEERIAERSQALVASERRYHDTLDKMMEGVQLIDPDWRYAYVNDALVAQSGYRREELIGRTMFEMYPGIESTALFAVLQQCQADRKARTLDNDFVFPNGRKGTFQLSIQPMSHGIFILSTDITERKLTEEALRASEARYHNALDTLIEGAQIIGYDWRHLYVNNSFAAQGAFTKEQLLGTTLMERYPGVETTKVFMYLNRCMTERSSCTVETGFTFPNGVYREFYLSIQPVAEGIFILSKDITERKRVELELAEQRKRLKEQNQELEQFTYIASHGLQEPLRMVSSYMQLLQRRYGDQLDTNAHEFIAFAVDGAQRMKQLIDDLLTFSRSGPSTGWESVDMNVIVGQATANLDQAIAEADATLRVDLLPQVVASCTDMLQVMQNLIGNALKFRRPGTIPEVCVKGHAEGTHWHFEVSDNGIGIDPAHYETIFAPFKRLNDRSKYKGSGIGLAIAQKIVHRYGGRIWVTSTPGEGSCFHFTLERNAP